MMEGQLQPKLRFPEFEGDWSIVKIGKIANIYDGTHQTPKYVTEGVPFVSVENIYDIENTDKFITREAFEKFKIKPKVGDILMTRITAGIIGATSIIKNNSDLGYYVSLALIRNISSNYIEFINHYISTDYFKRELHKRIIHVAFPKKINLGDINQCFIKISSSLPEQQKIADYLSTIDTKLNLLEEKKEQLSLYKKAIMQKLFSLEIRFKDENGNDFSEWEEKRLGEVSDINKGQQLNKENFIEDGKFKVLNGGISYSGLTNNFNRKGNIITISEGGNSCGYTNYITEDFWLGGHCYALDNLNNNINDKFLFQNLKFNEYKIMSLRVGSGLPNIQKGDLSKLSINIPSLLEQQKNANFLSAIDENIEKVNEQITQTQSFKKAMLQQMFV